MDSFTARARASNGLRTTSQRGKRTPRARIIQAPGTVHARLSQFDLIRAWVKVTVGREEDRTSARVRAHKFEGGLEDPVFTFKKFIPRADTPQGSCHDEAIACRA